MCKNTAIHTRKIANSVIILYQVPSAIQSVWLTCSPFSKMWIDVNTTGKYLLFVFVNVDSLLVTPSVNNDTSYSVARNWSGFCLAFDCAQDERQHGTCDPLCSVFLRRAQKNRTQRITSTMLPFVLSAVEGQAQSAPNAGDRVTRVI